LGHLATAALRALDLTLVMLAHREYNREVVPAFLTLILVSRHSILLLTKLVDQIMNNPLRTASYPEFTITIQKKFAATPKFAESYAEFWILDSPNKSQTSSNPRMAQQAAGNKLSPGNHDSFPGKRCRAGPWAIAPKKIIHEGRPD
jgi:hypothetical protein